MSNYDMAIDCLKRAMEVLESSRNASEVSIEIKVDMYSIPTLEYSIKEIAPSSEEK